MALLIVDDDALFRRALQRRMDVESRTASSLREGLRAAAEWQPSVILLDVWFGEQSSLDWITEFKRVCPRAEIIVMTGRFVEGDGKRALELGAFSYAEKRDSRELKKLVQDARLLVSSVFVSPSVQLLH